MTDRFSWRRFAALAVKELRQTARNRRLTVMLLALPPLNLMLFGVAMNPEVTNLRLGVVDESRTAESRDLISAFVENGSFREAGRFPSTAALGEALAAGGLDAGLVVPPDYDERLARGAGAEVQLVVDGVNSNTAAIAVGYAERIAGDFGARLAPPADRGARARVAVLYNPGLRSSWFITTGVLGMLLVLLGSVAASSAMVREKETGTIEQLMMTPAGDVEVILAKVAPCFLLLTLDLATALVAVRLAFDLPARGSLGLLFGAGSLCVLAGIGIGTATATATRTQAQAQLLGFFINPPLALLSGATTPIEAVPEWLRPLAQVNPIYHFGVVARGVLLKGVGADVLFPHLAALAVLAAVIVGVSVWRFRRQMA